jgi:type II secretory pathway pseudopilin PulG
VELLTVMIIMMIVMTIALPAFRRLTGGTGVEAAARMVGAQLRLARQEAIAQRKRIAILFPAAGQVTDPPDVGYQAFRACIVDRSNAFQSWVENTSWQYVPTGTVIAEVDDDHTGGIDDPPSDGGGTLVSGVPEDTGAVGVRAVVFMPTGKLVGERRYATVVEGTVPANGGAVLVKNRANYIHAVVDQYTGRISFEYPED